MSHEQTNTRTSMLRAVGILTAGLVIGLVARSLTAEQTKDSMTARLQAVEDRLAIEQLLLGDYSKAIDSQNIKAIAAMFTDDGELRLESNNSEPKVYKGHAEIERGFMSPPPAGAPGPPPGGEMPQIVSMKHLITNFSVQLHGDQATVRAYWTATSMTKDGKSMVGAIARYDDTFKRENGRWKFHRIVITDVPEGGAIAMPAPPAPPARR